MYVCIYIYLYIYVYIYIYIYIYIYRPYILHILAFIYMTWTGDKHHGESGTWSVGFSSRTIHITKRMNYRSPRDQCWWWRISRTVRFNMQQPSNPRLPNTFREGIWTIYHHISSYIIIYHHISSYIIIYHHLSSYIIIFHHISSYIIIYIIMYHHISSYIIIFHHISSYIIIYIIMYIIMYHHVSSYIIIYHRISSYSKIYHHISSYIIIYRHKIHIDSIDSIPNKKDSWAGLI